MRILILTLFLLRSVNSLDDWACGNEDLEWTRSIAKFIAWPAGDKPYINNCCITHDKVMVLWEKHGLVDLEKSDNEFADCLRKSKFLYTRYVVRPIYYCTVRLYSIWETGSWKKVPEAIWNAVKFW